MELIEENYLPPDNSSMLKQSLVPLKNISYRSADPPKQYESGIELQEECDTSGSWFQPGSPPKFQNSQPGVPEAWVPDAQWCPVSMPSAWYGSMPAVHYPLVTGGDCCPLVPDAH